MTPDEQIAAERERFEAKYSQLPVIPLTRDESGFYNHHTTLWVWTSWLDRAEIARAEQAELRSENERLRERTCTCCFCEAPFTRLADLKAHSAVCEKHPLRERVKKLARDNLESILRDLRAGPDAVSATAAWQLRDSELERLAEEAGVWFDDQGNEWSLDKWRARMGGAG